VTPYAFERIQEGKIIKALAVHASFMTALSGSYAKVISAEEIIASRA
jgi:glycogen synthase